MENRTELDLPQGYMPLIERSNVVDADASVVPKLCRSEGDDSVLASVAEAMLKLARQMELPQG